MKTVHQQIAQKISRVCSPQNIDRVRTENKDKDRNGLLFSILFLKENLEDMNSQNADMRMEMEDKDSTINKLKHENACVKLLLDDAKKMWRSKGKRRAQLQQQLTQEKRKTTKNEAKLQKFEQLFSEFKQKFSNFEQKFSE